MAGKRGGTEKEKKLHEYLVSHSARSNAALEGLQQESLKHRQGLMLSPPDSIAILQLLAKLVNAKTIVEVGVYTGYTALGMALLLPEDGKLYALDITDEYLNAIGRPYWQQAGVTDKIKLMIAPASESLEKLYKEKGPACVDMAFIDADKSNYDTYYEYLLRLVRPGGIIVVDNVFWGGRVVNESDESEDTKAIRALNDKIYTDKRVQPAMLKNSDGITVCYVL